MTGPGSLSRAGAGNAASVVETLQHQWELDQLQTLVRGLQPLSVLEIGIWDGGTLAGWIDSAARIVGVDVQVRRAVAERFAEYPSVRLIQGDCEDDTVKTKVAAYAPFDFIFLDADHQYAAARRHWNLYKPMVSPGGVFAFHDIRRYEHGDLDRLWTEIKAEPGARTIEFHQNNADWGGIGAVYL